MNTHAHHQHQTRPLYRHRAVPRRHARVVFYEPEKSYTSAGSKGAARGNARPRRITVKIATAASERVIGRALSFAKPGYAKEELELLTHPSLTQNQTMLPVHWQGNLRFAPQDLLEHQRRCVLSICSGRRGDRRQLQRCGEFREDQPLNKTCTVFTRNSGVVKRRLI